MPSTFSFGFDNRFSYMLRKKLINITVDFIIKVYGKISFNSSALALNGFLSFFNLKSSVKIQLDSTKTHYFDSSPLIFFPTDG